MGINPTTPKKKQPSPAQLEDRQKSADIRKRNAEADAEADKASSELADSDLTMARPESAEKLTAAAKKARTDRKKAVNEAVSKNLADDAAMPPPSSAATSHHEG